MAKPNYFNKGLLKGRVVKAEIVEFEGREGKDGGSFLSIEVESGNGNKNKATLFPSKKAPNKHREMLSSYPVGSMVEVSGSVNEKPFKSSSGKEGIDRSVSAFSIRPLGDGKSGATFIIQGIVSAPVRETEDGVVVKVDFIDSYEGQDGKTVKKDPVTFTLEGGSDIAEMADDLSVVKGCNAKFKGQIINSLEFDDYGDIIGSTQMFKIEKIENVIDPSDLEEDEEDMPEGLL